MHSGEDLHGCLARIIADEFLVNFENAFQLAVEDLAINMGQVEVDHRLAVNAQAVLVHDFMYGARGHVTRDQIAVLGIPLLEEVPAFACWDGTRITFVARLLRHPNAAALTTGGLRHQPQLVLARYGSGVHLDELAIGVKRSLLVERGLGRSRAHHRIRGFSENGADPTRGDDDRIGGERAHFHAAQINGANPTADPAGIQDRRKELPMLVLLHLAFCFMTADLLVQGI